jgi:hypothetical protein
MDMFMRKVTRVLLAVVFLSGGMWSGASDVWAKKKADTLTNQVKGSWTLVSLYVEKDGKKVEPFGSKPRGSMILTPDGRFSIIIMRESLPKFAANDRVKGTTEENQAVVTALRPRLVQIVGSPSAGTSDIVSVSPLRASGLPE